MDRMGSAPILSAKRSVTINIMLNFDGYDDGTNSVITLTVAETETGKKIGCIGLYEGVHIAQRQITTQRSHWVVIGLGLGLGHCQSDWAINL